MRVHLSPKKKIFFSLTTVSFDTTTYIKQVLLQTQVQNCERIPGKRLFYESQKVATTGYYGIENALSDIHL